MVIKFKVKLIKRQGNFYPLLVLYSEWDGETWGRLTQMSRKKFGISLNYSRYEATSIPTSKYISRNNSGYGYTPPNIEPLYGYNKFNLSNIDEDDYVGEMISQRVQSFENKDFRGCKPAIFGFRPLNYIVERDDGGFDVYRNNRLDVYFLPPLRSGVNKEYKDKVMMEAERVCNKMMVAISKDIKELYTKYKN